MWLLYAPSISPVQVISVHDLPSQASGVTGIWLSGDDGRDVGGQLLEIRRLPSHAHLPVFAATGLPEALRELADGEVVSLTEAIQRAAAWRPLPTRLPAAPHNPAVALARYLFLRPFVALTPQRDFRAHQAYRYPLAEAFSDGPHPESLIGVLMDRGWLEQGHLIDRLRRCDACESAHLNYVDLCPCCNSLNIRNSLFIHCFTCSHVAPQESFFAGGVLSCPNCHARLRHIGVDYNRPLEQMDCQDCGSCFAEARVVARCLACGKVDDPEKLPVLNVAAYTLSDAGRQVAREGGEVRWYAGVSPGYRIFSPASFADAVDWMANLARRHGAPWFTLLGIRVELAASAVPTLGSVAAREMREAFVERIREQMRDTDLLTQVGCSLVWVGLPHTDREGALALLSKIVALAEEAEVEGAAVLEISGHVFTAADLPGGGGTATFLESLGGKLEQVGSC